MACNKIVTFRVTPGNIHSFRIRSKETLRVMYPECPVFYMIQRNPPPFGIIWINDLCLDFSKEMKDPFSD